MEDRVQYRLRYIPWMTLTLIGGLWAIHLWAVLFSTPQDAREAYGLAFEDLFSYLTHALIHDVGLQHIISNTLPVLLLGSCLEAQVGRRWYGVAIVLSILAGVSGVFTLQTTMGLSSHEKGIGFSAATNALMIMGIGVIIYQWRGHLAKVTCGVTLTVLLILLMTIPNSLWKVGSLEAVAAFAVLVIGIGAILYWVWERDRGGLSELTPLAVVLVLLTIDLSVRGWTYTAAAHLGGSIMGVVLILPALRGREPSKATLWMKEGFCRPWIRTWEWVTRMYETKWFEWTALTGLVVILVVMVWVADLSPGNHLWQLLTG